VKRPATKKRTAAQRPPEFGTYSWWRTQLQSCHASRKQKQFVIGDAIVLARDSWTKHGWFGTGLLARHGLENRTGRLWRDAAAATGHPVDSLMQWARVAAVFPPKSRTYDISFSCYHAIAGISNERQRIALCEKAEKQSLSCEQVRLLVQKIQNKKTKSRTRKLTIQITVDAYSALRDAAIERGTTVRKLAAQTLSAKGE
jgi:hypothetical protein